MPVVIRFDAICGQCDSDALMYSETEQDLVAKIMAAGWSVYPLLCKPCARHLREKVARESQDSGTVRDPGEGSERA